MTHTTETMTNAEQVARSLSEDQRDWILAAEPTLEPVAKDPSAEWWTQPRLCVEIDGRDYWFGSKRMTSPAGSAAFTEGFEQLNDLGLAVREILIRERQS